MPSTLMLLSNPFRPDPRVMAEIRALKEVGIKVTLVSWDRDGTGPSRAEEHGIEILRLGPPCPPRSAAKVLRKLPRFWLNALIASKGLDFDIVHAHDFDTLPLGHITARLKGKPLLYDAHELYAKMVEHEVGPIWRLIWFWELACARRADAVITVSDSLALELSKRRKDGVTVVSTSQDPSILEGLRRDTVLAKYGLKGFILSYLGSLEPGRFAEEAASSFNPGDGVTVVMGGTGTLRPRIEELAKTNTWLKFIGVVGTDEALRLTYSSDLVVAMMDPSNPNNVVGTPGKIVNALACGRPMITNEGLQIAERIRHADAGIVVPYSRDAFREAVLSAKRDPKRLEAMGRNGRALYEREFSWEKSKENLLSVYRRLLPRA